MEPGQLTTAEWGQIGTALKLLWLAAAAAFISGTSFVTAHAILPSALATGTVKKRWVAGVRPIFYLTGVVGLVCLVVFIVLAASNMDWLRIYERFWQ